MRPWVTFELGQNFLPNEIFIYWFGLILKGKNPESRMITLDYILIISMMPLGQRPKIRTRS